MSQHRRHYLDLNPAPGLWMDDIAPRGASRYVHSWVLVALALALLLVQTLAAVYPRDTPKPADKQAFESTAAAVEAARIEGFRAGYETALENGCAGVPLSPPIR